MLRRLLLVCASLSGAVVLLVLAAFAYAQTRTAKEQIGGLIESRLSSQTQKADVKGLGGLLPFDVRIGRFALSDSRGTWLEVEDARVEVKPTALLAGRVHVEQAGARRVRIERLPPGEPAPAAQGETVGLPRPPRLPAELPVFAVDRLQVDALELGDAVLGRAATFAIEGRAATDDAGTAVELSLEARRTDEETAEVSLSAGADLGARTVRLDLSASETGGLVGTAVGRPEAGAARLSFTAGGPLSDLRARLRAEIERLARLDADLALAWTDSPSLDLTASLDAEPGALPDAYAELLGRRATVALAAGETAPGVFALERLSVEAAALEAEGSGRISVDAGSIEGGITARVPDLSRASKLAGIPLAGSLDLVVEAQHGAEPPAVDLRLEGRQLLFGRFGVASLGGDLTVGPAAPLAQGWRGADVGGTVRLRDAALDGEPLRPESDLDLEADLRLPAEGAVTIRSLLARGRHLELTGSGTFEPTRVAGELDLGLEAADLAALLQALGPLAPQGLQLAGAAGLEADIRIAEGAAAVDTDFTVTTRGLSGLPPGAAELLGPAPGLRGSMRYAPDAPLRLADFELEGAAATLTGEVEYGIADGSLDGGLALAVPELAVLEPLVGQPLAGAAQLDLELGGRVDSPDIRGELAARPLTVAGRAFDEVVLTATVVGPPEAVGGELALVARKAQESAQLATGWRLAEGKLRLADLALNAPATRLAGTAEIDLSGPLVRGELSGAVQDLAALEGWIGRKLAGSARIDARFDVADGAQTAAIEAELAEILGDFGGLYAATLRTKVEDAFGTPRVEAMLHAREFTQPGLRIESAVLELEGPLDALRVVAAVEGERVEPFALRAEAGANLLGARKELVIERLRGRLGERELLLRKPATAVLENGLLQVDELDLLLGEGEIRGGLRLENGSVDAFARARTLPVAPLASFGGLDFTGTADIDLVLEGPAGQPRLGIEGRLAGLRPADDLYGDLPAADLTFRGRDEQGRLRLDFEVTKLEGTSASGWVEVPLAVSATPPAVRVDPRGRIAGRLDADLELATLAAAAGLDGQKVEGPMTLALRLDGTMGSPELSGSARIRDARIEDSVTGLTLVDLVLDARARGDRIVLNGVRATDGREGTLEGEGELVLGEPSGLAYAIRLQLDDFVVSDNSVAWVVADAKLAASGDARHGSVAGRIEVDAAEIGMPSGGGPEIPVLAVEEVGDGGPPWQPDFAAFGSTGEGPVYTLALDVQVDMPARGFVRGRGLQSEWGGAFHVVGTATAPEIEGRIEIRRGYVDLLGRRFVIRDGELRFVGSNPPTPELRIEAVAEGDGMTAIVRLAGPATDPEVELDSDPALPKDEILARLLFGRDVSAITPMQGIRLAATLQQLEGGGGLDALAGLRETIGVDTLDIGGESFAEAYVSAGTYVADNVFVEVEQRLASGETSARVEVELTPAVKVVSEIGDASSGVELEWRYDY